MRDEKEERKKQARSNKQTRQSNTAHPRQSLVHVDYLAVHTSNTLVQKSLYNTHSYTVYMYMYMCMLLASFFLPSHLSFKNMHIGGRRYVSSCQETMSFLAECTGSQEHKASKSADISQHVYTRDASTYECTRTTSLPMVQHYLRHDASPPGGTSPD